MATAGKLPIPPLRTTAYTAKKAKKRQTLEEKKANKLAHCKKREKTRINVGASFTRWRRLRECKGLKTDADVARFLLDRYHQTPQDQPGAITLKRGSSGQTCETVLYKCQMMMSSGSKNSEETPAAPSDQSSEDGKDSTEGVQSEYEGMTTNQDEEEFDTSLLIGDGLHLVDLGSSSEFVVDEECLLQLFQSCQACNRQCRVTKYVKGLKLKVSQACYYCEHRFQWTNLKDISANGGLQVIGKKAAQGQSDSSISQSESVS